MPISFSAILKRALLTFLLPFLLSACAGEKPVRLTETEASLFQARWKTAEHLAEYDRLSRIAADTLTDCLDSILSAGISGWVVVPNGISAQRVLFGSMKEDSLLCDFEVRIAPEENQWQRHTPPITLSGTEARLFAAREIAFKANQNRLTRLGISFNSYAWEEGDSVTVYFMPGALKGRAMVGGGIRCRVTESTVQTTQLHPGLSAIRIEPDTYGIRYDSPKDSIINEADIAQYLIGKTSLPNRRITTPKYCFQLSYQPETGKDSILVFPAKHKAGNQD